MSDQKPSSPRAAATVLLLRDGVGKDKTPSLEVFMVVRHHQIDFASGALVFPGGKVAAGDGTNNIRDFVAGDEDLDDEMLSIYVAAIRESFEECGVLLAHDKNTGDMVTTDRLIALEDYRPRLDKGEVAMADFLQAENLVLDLGGLVRFAHWITPKFMPKRFDTHFLLVKAPADQIAGHDGHEAVDSVWISPAQALEDWKAGERTVIFPTRMNLIKLARSTTVAEALETARSAGIVSVEPWVEKRDDGDVLCIPAEADYGVTEEPLAKMMG